MTILKILGAMGIVALEITGFCVVIYILWRLMKFLIETETEGTGE